MVQKWHSIFETLSVNVSPSVVCSPEMKTVQARADHELIERCIKGDQSAWNELVKRYQRLVYSVAHVLCPSGEDVSDIFQQVWLELYQQLADLRKVEALPAWLITVTRRRVYATMQSRRVSEPLDAEIPDLSERVRQIEYEHTLERALGQLPERCKKLINLLYFDSKEPNYSEISQLMDMPEASIGPTRARCLEKLRKLIS
jgi:RNA polymerase sigma factor (sigma-70 family)